MYLPDEQLMFSISCLVFYTVVNSIRTLAKYLEQLLEPLVVALGYPGFDEPDHPGSPHVLVLVAHFPLDLFPYLATVPLRVLNLQPSLGIDVVGCVFDESLDVLVVLLVGYFFGL